MGRDRRRTWDRPFSWIHSPVFQTESHRELRLVPLLCVLDLSPAGWGSLGIKLRWFGPFLLAHVLSYSPRFCVIFSLLSMCEVRSFSFAFFTSAWTCQLAWPPSLSLSLSLLLRHSGHSHVFHAIRPPWRTKMNVSMLVLCKYGPTTFGVQSGYRAKAREAFVRWDCGERVGRAALRGAAPAIGSYQVGDIVSYRREGRACEHGLQWQRRF